MFHGELDRRDGWPRCGRVTCRRHRGVPVRMRPLLLPLSSCSAGSSVGGMGGLDAVTSPDAGTGVCRSGCVRSSFSPFPRPRACWHRSTDVRGGASAVAPPVGGCQLGQSRGLCVVSGLSGCRAAARTVGGAAFGGGACISGAGGQPWPRGRRGCGWLTELGCNRGGEHRDTPLAQSFDWPTVAAAVDALSFLRLRHGVPSPVILLRVKN